MDNQEIAIRHRGVQGSVMQGTRMISPASSRPFRGRDLSGAHTAVTLSQVLGAASRNPGRPIDVPSPVYMMGGSFDRTGKVRQLTPPLEFYCAYCDARRDRANCPACGHHTHLMREIK